MRGHFSLLCLSTAPLRGEESTLMDNFPSLFGIHPPAEQALTWPSAPGIRYTGTVLWAEARVSQDTGDQVGGWLGLWHQQCSLCCYTRHCFPLTNQLLSLNFQILLGKENGSPSNFLQGTSPKKILSQGNCQKFEQRELVLCIVTVKN